MLKLCFENLVCEARNPAQMTPEVYCLCFVYIRTGRAQFSLFAVRLARLARLSPPLGCPPYSGSAHTRRLTVGVFP